MACMPHSLRRHWQYARHQVVPGVHHLLGAGAQHPGLPPMQRVPILDLTDIIGVQRGFAACLPGVCAPEPNRIPSS